jgi:hypothetical protein
MPQIVCSRQISEIYVGVGIGTGQFVSFSVGALISSTFETLHTPPIAPHSRLAGQPIAGPMTVHNPSCTYTLIGPGELLPLDNTDLHCCVSTSAYVGA